MSSSLNWAKLYTPSTQSYPYSENIDDIGYDYLTELSAVWSKQVGYDTTRRFYFGGIAVYQTSSKTYTTANIDSTEALTRFGAGPIMSYDVWRNDQLIFNLYTALIFNFYDEIKVTQAVKGTGVSETNTFSSIHFTPRFGGNLQFREVLSSFDLVFGFNSTINLPHTYSGSISSDYPDYWQDSYENKWMANLTYSIGLQSNY